MVPYTFPRINWVNTDFKDGEISGIQTTSATNHLQEFDIDEFLATLPQQLSPLTHQAGGHVFSKEKIALGLLKDSRGYILKPLRLGDERSKTELNFYEEVKNGYHPLLASLIPRFCGKVSIPFKGLNVEFMALEDLTYGFDKPCVLDMKIGKRTWSPGASADKIKKEQAKSTALKEFYGFSIPGMVIIDPVTNTKSKLDNNIARTFAPEAAVKEIERFVSTTRDSRATAALVKHIIVELERILSWASTQTELRLYASSILIVYDSQALFDIIPKFYEDSQPGYPLDFVRVKLVDFAHTHKAPEHEGIDENYLRGVKSVLSIFKDILKEVCNSNVLMHLQMPCQIQ